MLSICLSCATHASTSALYDKQVRYNAAEADVEARRLVDSLTRSLAGTPGLLTLTGRAAELPMDSAVAAADTAKARKPWFALKNNLLYDAALTPNLTLEARLSKHWTLQIEAGFNPWPLDDKVEHKWRHVLVGAEAKYWFNRAFRCDFIGVNAYYTHFNVAKGNYPVGWLYPDVKQYRLQGDAVMAGVSYGWAFPVSKHVAFELEAGVDAGYAWFNRFECPHCGALIDSPRRWFAVPKAGVNISVVLPQNDDDDCPCRKWKEEEELAQTTDTIASLRGDSLLGVDSLSVRPVGPVLPVVPAGPEDTVVPVIPVAPVAEPAPLSAPERLKSRILHPFSEYRPYSSDMVLARDSDALYVYFELDSTVLKRDFAGNGVILDSIVQIVTALRQDTLTEMRMIQIVGFASFEGPTLHNNQLAGARADALKQYIQSHVDVPDSLFEVNNGGEGWAEITWMLEQSNYPLKDKVLQIIREEPNPAKREQRIRSLNNGWVFEYIRDYLLHRQRNSGYIRVYFDKLK